MINKRDSSPICLTGFLNPDLNNYNVFAQPNNKSTFNNNVINPPDIFCCLYLSMIKKPFI